jgi:hypothetical protein
MNSFLNNRSFEFRKDTEHLEKRLASWRGSVDSAGGVKEGAMTQFSIDERTGALEEVARAGSSRQVRTRSGHGRSTVTVL